MAEPLHTLPPQVAAALQRGNLVEAIKVLREQRPQMGMAEAKALIVALQKEALAARANVKAQAPGKAGMTPHAPHSPSAPHVPRQQSAEAHAAALAATNPHVSPGEVPRSSNLAAAVAIVVGVVVVAMAATYFGR